MKYKINTIFKTEYFWILTILSLVLLFFWKVFLKSLLPIPADITTGVYYPWLNQNWGFPTGVPVKNPLLTDAISLLYPWRTLAMDTLKQGIFPFWNNTIFSGMPLFANFQSGVINPANIAYFFLSNPYAWTFGVITQSLAAALTMFFLLRYWKITRISSLLGSVAYAFSGFALVWYAYNTHVWVIGWFPLIILSTEKVLNNQSKWIAIGAIAFSLSIYAGYPQLVIYQLLITALLVYWRSKSKFSQLKWLSVTKIFILGILLSSPLLITGWSTLQNSIRDVDNIATLVELRFLPWRNIITIIAPDYFGNPSTYNFWGMPHYDNFAYFPGVVVVSLSLITLTRLKKDKDTLFFWLILLLGLFLALPHPISIWISDLGIFGTKSIAARSLFLVVFASPILAARGLDNLFKLKFNKLLLITLPLITLAMFYSLTPFASPEFLTIARRNLILPLFISITLLSIVFGKPIAEKIGIKINIKFINLFILTLAVFELFRFGWKYISFVPVRLVFPTTPTTDFLTDQQSPFRVEFAEVITENNWTPYALESAAGYDAMTPRRYSEFIGAIGSHQAGTPVGRIGKIHNYESPLFDLSGTEYLLALRHNQDGTIGRNGQVKPEYTKAKFTSVFQEGGVEIVKNTQAFPRAFFVDSLIYTTDPNQIIDLMHTQDLHATAVVESEVSQPSNSTGKITWINNSPGLQELKLSADQDSFLVITNNFDPGWQAYIDDNKVPVVRTDFTFQGIAIPRGEHILVTKYKPLHLNYSLIIMGIGVLLTTKLLWQKY